MGPMNLKVLVFIDDLIIFSSSLEEHEQRLKKVLLRLKEFGLNLAPEKCKFFHNSVKYLTHIVSECRVETDTETQKCQEVFEQIIGKLTSAPVLGFADPKLLYILHKVLVPLALVPLCTNSRMDS